MKVTDTFEFQFYGERFEMYRTNTRRLYLPLVRLCEAIGIDVRSQQRKIQGHKGISDGLVKLPVMTAYRDSFRERDVWCLDLKRLPYWLGALDANRIKRHLRDKVFRFQRELSDVAWAAFRKQIVDEDFLEEVAAPDYSLRLEVIERRLNVLEARLTGTDYINSAQQHQFTQMVATLAYALADAKSWNKSKAFATVHNTVKKQFQVPSYQLIPEKHFRVVIKFLSDWYRRTRPEEALPAVFKEAQNSLI